MLTIQNIKKYYGGIKAVDDCSFNVAPGSITALIGPNGAGKSTVFNLISGLEKIDSGAIIFNNKKISNLSPERISNLGLSRLFQQSRLFNNLTIKDNLLLALNNDDTKFFANMFKFNFKDKKQGKIIKQALEEIDMVGLGEYLAKDLSYGQKRLVEIQRARLNPHQLLILDEPVAGVNPHLRRKIAQILRTTNQQKHNTILLIEHDMDFTLSLADWVIVMDEGRVLAQGKPLDIKNNPKVLVAYLGE